MVKLVSAKCPNCGAALKLSKEDEQTKCEFCQQTIIVDDAIACYKLKISGTISVDGIETNSDLIDAANELLEMEEFLKAKRKFLEFSEKCPNNYQGWLGLLICRTRNFTIKDNNIMFENDINKYYEHFLKVAPDEIKENYIATIENYLHPVDENLTTNKVASKNIQSFKLDPKYKPYIFPIIYTICGIALLTNSIYVGGLFWTIGGLILIPQIKEKLKLSKKKAIIISIILGIIGFIAFGIEYPRDFEGKWETDVIDYKIEFKHNNTFTINNENKIIKGTYSYEYKYDNYFITIKSKNKEYNNKEFKYDSYLKKLCIYENKSCTYYFEKETNE